MEQALYVRPCYIYKLPNSAIKLRFIYQPCDFHTVHYQEQYIGRTVRVGSDISEILQ